MGPRNRRQPFACVFAAAWLMVAPVYLLTASSRFRCALPVMLLGYRVLSEAAERQTETIR